MQSSFTVKQSQPYILKTYLLPTEQSSFIQNLIVTYNKKLGSENEEFKQKFKQKQQKIQRHKEQLNLLHEMKNDPQLMNKILEQIEIKDYEKQFRTILVQKENTIFQKFTKKGEKSFKDKSIDKENSTKTFHITRRNIQKQLSVDNANKTTQRDLSIFTQANKKFRSTVIKSSSFSAIKRANTPFSTKTNFYIQSIRNSEDANSPQQGLINYFNLKDTKLSEALYGKRPSTKNKQIQKETVSINNKKVSNLSPQWMRQYASKQKKVVKINDIQQNDKKNDQIKVSLQSNFVGEQKDQFFDQKQQKIKNDLKKKQRFSVEEQENENVPNEIQGHTKRTYLTKMQELKRNLESSRDKLPKGNPYHISNFIKQLNIYKNGSSSSHNLGKITKSKRKFVAQINGE